jgi:glycosyltransferase involved in cell wall biosynthesis
MPSALIVSHSADKGGAELFLIDLMRRIEGDWRACFLTDGPAVAEVIALGRPPITLSAGKSMMSIRRGSSLRQITSALRDVLMVARELARHAQNYDVICANTQKAFVVSALAAFLSRKPLVWILHDIMTDPSFSAPNRRAVALLARLFARRVAVNSEATGRAFTAIGGQPDKVRLVYNGFDTQAARTTGPKHSIAIREDLGLSDAPLVGLFGRLDRWKGQHVLLGALAQLDGTQAILAGGALFGPGGYDEELRALVTELGLTGRVRLLGHRADVPALMAAVDIVVHTSISPEPFGRVIVEGMLSERPVVATRGGGVDEIIKDGSNGLLVSPEDPAELAGAIQRLIDEPQLAVRLAAAGRADAAERFSLQTSHEMLEAVLIEATGTAAHVKGQRRDSPRA